MKFICTTVSLVLASLIVCGVFAFCHIFLPASQPAHTVDFRVEQGESFSSIVRRLREQKIISNEPVFYLWGRISGAEKRIQWGLYRFELPLSPQAILKQIVGGKGIFYRVTIPEGLTVKEIAELLAKMAIVDKDRFLAEASNPELLATLGLKDKALEGYLFPNTYQFTPSTPEKEVILTMAEQFRKVFEPLIDGPSRESSLTPHDILTLASIIEKETGVDAERPLVSAVFHNRLKLNMPLQSDPTVIYGIKDFNGNLTRKDLQHPSPYNTYRIPSLPPGPICNPGLSSIKAALQPAVVPYLYFVSKNDGTHLFSESLESHKRAVKSYQPRAESLPRKTVSRVP